MSENIDIKIREDGSRVVSRNIADIADESNKAESAIDRMNKSLAKDNGAESALTRLQNSIQALEKTTETYNQTLLQQVALNQQVKASTMSLSDSHTSAANTQKYWNTQAREGHALARGLSGSLGQLWLTYGAILPLLTGAALGSAFVGAAKAGSEMAYQLEFVKQLGGESKEIIQQLSEKSIELAKTGPYAPKEIASGFRILSQAGVEARDSLVMMKDVLNLATVGEIDLNQASLAIVGTLNAFKLGVGDSAHVSDLFAKAAAASQASVQDLTQSMRYGSTVGTQYKQNVDETMTALALLAKVNIVGTSAGTAYRNMLKELFTPTKEVAKVWKELGIEMEKTFKGPDGQDIQKVKSFVEIIDQLREKMNKLDEPSQLRLKGYLGGERGSKEMVAMLEMNKKEWDDFYSKISQESDGFAGRVAGGLNKTAKTEWKTALNTLEATLVESFNKMEPAFITFAQRLGGLFDSQEFKDSVLTFIQTTTRIGQALLDATPYIYEFVKAWLALKAAHLAVAVGQGVLAVATGAQAVAAGMLAASGAMGPVAKGASMLTPLLAALGGPITIITGLLVAGAYAWFNWGDKSAEAMEKAGKAAQGASANIRNMIEQQSVGIKASAQSWDLAGLQALKTRNQAGEAIQEKLNSAYPGLQFEEGRIINQKKEDITENIIKKDNGWAKDVTSLLKQYQGLTADVKIANSNMSEALAAEGKVKDAFVQVGNGSPGKDRWNAPEKGIGNIGNQVSEYERLIRSIKEKISVSEAEAAQTEKLGAADAAYTKFLTDLTGGYLKLSTAEKIEAATLYDRWIAQEKSNKSVADAVKAQEALAKWVSSTVSEEEKQVNQIEKETAKLQEQLETVGLSTEQLALYKQEKANIAAASELQAATELEAAAAMLEGVESASAARDAYLRLAAAKRKAAGAMQKQGDVSASLTYAKDATDKWKKFSDDIERGLTDSLYRSFESGKDFGETFIASLKNLFKTTVLKIAVQGVMSGVTGMFSTGSAAGTAGASGTSLMGMASNASSAYSLYSNGVGGYVSGFGNAIGSGSVSAYGTGMGLTSAQASEAAWAYYAAGGDANIAAGSAIEAGSAGASTLGAAATAAGWLAVAYLVLDYFGSAGGSAKIAATALAARKANGELSNPLDAYGLTATDTTVYARPTDFNDPRDGYTDQSDGAGMYLSNAYYADMAKATNSEIIGGFAGALQKSLNLATTVASDYVKKLGGTLPDMSYYLAADQDPGGTAPDSVGVGGNWTDASGKAQSFSSAVNGDRGQTSATVTSQLQRLTLATVAAAEGLPPVFQDYIATVNVATATTEQLTAAMTEMTKIDALRQGFVRLGADADSLTLSLIQAAGGTDALATLTSSYYDNFYSASEKQANALAEVGKELAAMGMALPTTRDGFRELVEQQYALGTAGEANVVTLLNLSSAFANVVPATEAAAEAVAALGQSMDDIASERASLQDRYDALAMTSAQLLDKQRNALDASNRGLFDQINALQDAKVASDDLAASQMAATESLRQAAQVAAQAASDGIDAAFSSLERAVSAQKQQIDSEFAAQQKQADVAFATQQKEWDAAISAASDIKSKLTGLADTIGGAVGSLIADSETSLRAERISAQKTLDDALAAANSGQSLTGYADSIKSAIAGISKPSESLYSTAVDYARAQGRANSTLSLLQGAASSQASVADMTVSAIEAASRAAQDAHDDAIKAAQAAHDAEIAALDDQLSAAQESINVLRGIDTSVLSVAAAIAALSTAMQTSTTGQWIASQGGSYYQSAAGAVGTQVTGAADYTITGKMDGQTATGAQAVSAVNSLLAKGDERGVYDLAKLWGVSLSDVDKLMGWQNNAAENWAIANGLPVFAAGGMHAGGMRLVGEQGPELEITGPSRIFSASQTSNMLGNINAELIAEIRSLRAEVAALRSSSERTADNTKAQESFMRRLSPDGQTISVTVAA